MSNIVIEKFIEEINKDIERNQVLGELDRAFVLSKCTRVILIMEKQIEDYGLPLPVEQIASVTREKR